MASPHHHPGPPPHPVPSPFHSLLDKGTNILPLANPSRQMAIKAAPHFPFQMAVIRVDPLVVNEDHLEEIPAKFIIPGDNVQHHAISPLSLLPIIGYRSAIEGFEPEVRYFPLCGAIDPGIPYAPYPGVPLPSEYVSFALGTNQVPLVVTVAAAGVTGGGGVGDIARVGGGGGVGGVGCVAGITCSVVDGRGFEDFVFIVGIDRRTWNYFKLPHGWDADAV